MHKKYICNRKELTINKHVEYQSRQVQHTSRRRRKTKECSLIINSMISPERLNVIFGVALNFFRKSVICKCVFVTDRIAGPCY